MTNRCSFFLFLLFLAGTILFFIRPIDDSDILTQIRLGYFGLDALVKTEPLIFWREGQGIANPGWLAQLFFALLDERGGLLLVRYGYAVLMSLSFALVLWVTMRSIYKQYSLFSYGLGWMVGILIMLSNSSVRPQGFSLLGCSLIFCLHYSKISVPVKLLSLAVIGLLWQNLHPSLPIGILVYGLLSLQNLDKERPLSWFLEVGAGGAILVICCFLTPDGFELLRVSQYNQLISMALGISEWLPAWSPTVIAAMVPFHLFFIVGMIMLILRRKDYNLYEASFFIIFSILTFYAARFGFYLGLLSVPFFVKVVEQMRPKHLLIFSPAAPVHKVLLITVGLIYLTLIAGMALSLPQVSSFFPRKAITVLKNHPEVHRIFDYREYGGALNYWGDRQWKQFIDGRLYLYPEKIWRLYNGIAMGDKACMDQLCEEYRPDALFFRKNYFCGFLKQVDAPEHEWCGKKWNKIYEDGQTVVLIQDRYQKNDSELH